MSTLYIINSTTHMKTDIHLSDPTDLADEAWPKFKLVAVAIGPLPSFIAQVQQIQSGPWLACPFPPPVTIRNTALPDAPALLPQLALSGNTFSIGYFAPPGIRRFSITPWQPRVKDASQTMTNPSRPIRAGG